VSVRFNHVAIAAHDRHRSAAFLVDLLGLAEPTSWGPFVSVTLDDGVRSTPTTAAGASTSTTPPAITSS